MTIKCKALADARALAKGAAWARRKANGHGKGRTYGVAFASWLRDHPDLGLINAQERAAGLWAMRESNWPAVETYLSTLPQTELDRLTMRKVMRKLGPPPKKRPGGFSWVADSAVQIAAAMALSDRAKATALKTALSEALR
jgi:hypothetical protein